MGGFDDTFGSDGTMSGFAHPGDRMPGGSSLGMGGGGMGASGTGGGHFSMFDGGSLGGGRSGFGFDGAASVFGNGGDGGVGGGIGGLGGMPASSGFGYPLNSASYMNAGRPGPDGDPYATAAGRMMADSGGGGAGRGSRGGGAMRGLERGRGMDGGTRDGPGGGLRGFGGRDSPFIRLPPPKRPLASSAPMTDRAAAGGESAREAAWTGGPPPGARAVRAKIETHRAALARRGSEAEQDPLLRRLLLEIRLIDFQVRTARGGRSWEVGGFDAGAAARVAQKEQKRAVLDSTNTFHTRPAAPAPRPLALCLQRCRAAPPPQQLADADGGAEFAAAAAAAAALAPEDPPPSVAEGGLRQSAGLRAYNWKLRAFLDEVGAAGSAEGMSGCRLWGPCPSIGRHSPLFPPPHSGSSYSRCARPPHPSPTPRRSPSPPPPSPFS